MYGLLGGNIISKITSVGWLTEKKQGWIHKGPWVKDYEKLVKLYKSDNKEKEIQLKNVQKREEELKKEKEDRIKFAYNK